MQAGYAQRIITPRTGCPLVGYGLYLGRTADKVLDDLMVRAVVTSHEGTVLAILTFDLVGFSIEHSDKLRGCISEALGTPPRNVLLSCTHTHSGPPTMFLRGMGEIDDDYLDLVDRAAVDTAVEAATDARDSEVYAVAEPIEPIGFNRVAGSLCPLDATMALLCFVRSGGSIHLLNYACHPVTLGVNKAISADYPGRVCRAFEDRGDHGIFLQGYCGNIDPICNQTHWGAGGEAEIEYNGRHLVSRMDRIRKYARVIEPVLGAGERRIRIEYDTPAASDLESHEELIRRTYPREKHPLVDRFVAEWREDAEQALRSADQLVLEDVPVQVLRVGSVRIAALPGEVFCELGIELRESAPLLLPAGYANGNVGYIPTAAAYERPGNYACYSAPRFYGAFPFTPSIEKRFLETTRDLLQEA